MRPAWLVLAIASGCGTTTDDRPATLPFITETIFKPTCAAAECHSNFARQSSYAFDSVANARLSFLNDLKLIDLDNLGTDHAQLLRNLTEELVGAPRMPYDAPLPNEDIALIRRWLDDGLTGICDPGAASACLSVTSTDDKNVTTTKFSSLACTDDGALDLKAAIVACPGGCAAGVCQ